MKKILRNLIGIGLMALLALFISIEQPDNAIAGERIARHSTSGTFDFSLGVDTTAAKNVDTFTVIAAGYGPPGWFTDLGGYTNLVGYISLEILSVDSGDAASDIPDTTKDSVEYILYTSCESDRSPNRIIEIDSLHKGGGTYPTVWFTIPSDSLPCENVYLAFIAAIADSDYSVARVAAKVHYRATWHMVAKP